MLLRHSFQKLVRQVICFIKKEKKTMTEEQKWEMFNIFVELLERSDIQRDEALAMKEQIENVLWGDLPSRLSSKYRIKPE
jgi:hypothetical protein